MDLTSVTPEEAYQKLSQAARTADVTLVSIQLERPPMGATQRLFARLYAERSLASRLNATYPEFGIFEDAYLALDTSHQIDQKSIVNFSVSCL
jgi:hypothetical protein